VLIAVATVVTYWPTVHNGFLQVAFDDAIVVDTVEIRALAGANLVALTTSFNHAHYVPLTMLSLALDYRVWALDPFGYHLTNIALHALTAVLVAVFLWPLMPSLGAATLAALIFALHPLQMEAVSLVIQRKTLLSGALFFAALIAYQAWRRSGRRRYYAAALAAFTAAALAKPIVISLPLLLWLYEYTFIDGRLRWRDKLPLLGIAAACAAAALGAHAEVGAVRSWHGGDPFTHVVMMARVTAEYLTAVFAPVAQSPIYYYRRALALQPLNLLALAALGALAVWLVVRRRRVPWTFFCAAWFALALLPESNAIPLAQLRADRFLYLPLLGPAIWIATGLARLPALLPAAWPGCLAVRVPGAALVAVFAVTTHDSAAVWRSDVTAWTRVAERHPWSATAFLLLGHAHVAANDPERAAAAYRRAVELQPDLAEARVALARIDPPRSDQRGAE
jgi:tetratricopeptide (TPR) repeat protein